MEGQIFNHFFSMHPDLTVGKLCESCLFSARLDFQPEDIDLKQPCVTQWGIIHPNDTVVENLGTDGWKFSMLYPSDILNMSQSQFSIFMRDLSGKRREFLVKSTTQVDHLKYMVEQALAVATNRQRLVFSGKQLESGKTLSDYNIEKENTIDVCVRLHGGGKRAKSTVDTSDIFMGFTPVADANDCKQVVDALNLKSVNVGPWIKSLKQEVLEELFETVESQSKSGNIHILCAQYMFAIQEYATLEVPHICTSVEDSPLSINHTSGEASPQHKNTCVEKLLHFYHTMLF
jgi:hypothetical protein